MACSQKDYGNDRKYDTPMLFKQFGRKKFKDERMFLQKVEEAYIREDIRPYIDKYVAQVLVNWPKRVVLCFWKPVV